MELDLEVLDETERIGFLLRSLYQQHGFSRYRMSKFEEYDLYSRNKDFLLSDGVITFTVSTGLPMRKRASARKPRLEWNVWGR